MTYKTCNYLLILSLLITGVQHNSIKAARPNSTPGYLEGVNRGNAVILFTGIAMGAIARSGLYYYYNSSTHMRQKLNATVNPFNDLLNAQTDEDRQRFAARLHTSQNPLRDTIVRLDNALTVLQSLTNDKTKQKNSEISAEIESKQRAIRLLIERIEKSGQYTKEKQEQQKREEYERQSQRERNANQAAQIALERTKTQERQSRLALKQQEADRLMKAAEWNEAKNINKFELFRENKRLTAEIEELKKQISRLERQASTDQSNINYWQTSYNNANETIKQKNRTETDLRNSNDALNKELNELKQKFDTLKKESNKSNQELKEVQQELSDLLNQPPAYTPPTTRSRPFSDQYAPSAPPLEPK